MKVYIDMDATLVDFAAQVTKLHAILFTGDWSEALRKIMTTFS